LYYIEKRMGAEAMAGMSRLAMSEKVSEIMEDFMPKGDARPSENKPKPERASQRTSPRFPRL
jgi:hypothetical protein